jgi:NADH dehydrogenase
MSKRILVIGAGFAGMWTALGAARLLHMARKENAAAASDIEVALVAPEAVLHVRPRLYEINPASMQAPLQPVFDTMGVKFIQGWVGKIDSGRKEVAVRDAGGRDFAVGYDRLVLATGSKLFRPDIPGLKEHSFSVDQLDEAAELDAHLAGLKELPETPGRNTVVVAGGGFTGIETAAEMPDRLRAALGANASVRVIVVERNDAIGPELGGGPRPLIELAFEKLGIETRLNTAVASVDADGLTLSDGSRIDAKTVIWTAGVRADALAAQIPGTHDRFGRLHVADDLSVIGVKDVFATGDVAYAATDDAGNHAMMSCQHAIGLGRASGYNVAADLLGRPTKPYRQPAYVTCLDLGAWGAVFTEGWERKIKYQGMEAKQLKHQINSEWIYPPRADLDTILAAADPALPVVA